MNKIWIINSVAFLSAFLLFQIEFIIAKIFLPNFGGSFMVWGACIVFFQAALLSGYAYAHCMVQRFGITKYRKLHLYLLLIPFLFFPGRALSLKYSLMDWPMVLEVFWKLALTIGPAFFVLSTMSIICQSWLASSTLPERENPYTLFAISNAGSFLALITYPFVFEMLFDLHIQQNIWRSGYILTVVMYLFALKFIDVKREIKKEDSVGASPLEHTIWLWFFYGVAGVMMFLAVTNLITITIAPAPLLWMLPLAVYLLTYVLNFKKNSWCPKWIIRYVHFILPFGILLYLFIIGEIFPRMFGLAFLLLFLFVICMFCQSRLYALRPNPRRLTFFYFIVSLGGFFGGLVATWLVPLISSSHLEYFLALCFVCLAWYLESPKISLRPISILFALGLVLEVYFGPKLLIWFRWSGLAIWIVLFTFISYALKKSRLGLLSCFIVISFLINMLEPLWTNRNYILRLRNYYGITDIIEAQGVRVLMHGFTVHGAQLIDSEKKFIPLTYYTPKSPAAELLIKEEGPKQFGVIGLGTGALAVYVKRNQSLDFFEIDSDIINIAKKYFTYIDIALGEVKFIVGDARLSLERMDKKNYKILIVDAFSGDSVPIHLLTTEALEVYRRHLSDDGIIVFHVTNRYIDLRLALSKTALDAGYYTAYKHGGDYISNRYYSDWIALTKDRETYRELITQYNWKPVSKKKYTHLKAWTDSYSNIIPYFINFKGLIVLLKEWKL